jgi:hypothetical protein
VSTKNITLRLITHGSAFSSALKWEPCPSALRASGQPLLFNYSGLRNSAAGGGLKHPRFFYYHKNVKYNHFHASKRPNIFNVLTIASAQGFFMWIMSSANGQIMIRITEKVAQTERLKDPPGGRTFGCVLERLSKISIP